MCKTHEKNAPDLKSIVRYSGKLVETNEQDFTVHQVVLCRCWRECRNDDVCGLNYTDFVV